MLGCGLDVVCPAGLQGARWEEEEEETNRKPWAQLRLADCAGVGPDWMG